MNTVELASLGGVFSLLVFWHFVADWLTQIHNEAMAKSSNHWERAWHCSIYMMSFFPIIAGLKFGVEGWFCLGWLFVSHFIEDTYIPVALWAKYVRRAPEFWKVELDEESGQERLPSLMMGLRAMAQTPLGMILIVVVDQLFHIATLLPIAYLAL